MRRMVLGMALTGMGLTGMTLTGGAATAQTPAPLDSGPGGKNCGEFLTLDTPDQLAALAAIQPLGDAIDTSDPDDARRWADDVAQACGDDAARPLEDAAAAALSRP